jgi:hypothetical protein
MRPVGSRPADWPAAGAHAPAAGTYLERLPDGLIPHARAFLQSSHRATAVSLSAVNLSLQVTTGKGPIRWQK